MNLKLEVKRFNNEDVIATSCGNETLYIVAKNKVTDTDGHDITSQFSGVVLPSDGFYHFEGGQFVVCPTWDGNTKKGNNIDEVFAAHGISK